MKRTLIVLAFLALPGGAACQAARDAEPRSDLEEAAATITPEDLRAGLSILAHDSMRGRDTPSPELEATARWIADRFREMGLEPGTGDGYLQRYAVETVVVDMDGSRAGVAGGGELNFGRDLGFPYGATAEGDFTGSVVVVSGSRGWRQALPDLDVAGKHVILVASPSREGAWAPTARRMRRFFRRSSGSPASIIVATDRPDRDWRSNIQRQRSDRDLRTPWDAGGRAPVFEIRDRALARLLAEHGLKVGELRDRAQAELTATPLEELTLTLSPRVRVVESITAPNVVGILRGSDPELRDQYLVYSAHMDHIGVGSPDASGDSINNGADDNASGTVTVVEVAEAFAGLETPPRRSFIFLLVSGEEKGLWGSEYFAANPVVPAERIVANLNADMVGRNWSDTIVVIGKEHSDLGRTMEEVGRRHPELNMAPIDDLWPEQRFYTRSDHYNFARIGVPILFFFNGTHEDYHRPSDEIADIDFEKMSRIGRLMFYLGVEVARRDEPPQWNPESFRTIVEGGR